MSNRFGQLAIIVEPAVMALGYELVGCELHRQPKASLLRVYVDGPNGIGLEDCAKISRQISAVLDVEDPIQGRYHLEVSSPGLDRPLFTAAHYRRFVGHQVEVLLRQPRAGRRRYKGVIHAVSSQDQITLEVDGTLLSIACHEIDKAHLIPNFGRKEK